MLLLLTLEGNKFLWFLLGGFVSILVVGNLFTGPLQDYFIFRPKRLAADFQYQFEVPYEEIWLDAPHWGRLNALWFKLPDRSAVKGVILCYHGNADNLARWGHLYHYFAQMGYDFLVYDYRGYGKSTGRRSQYIMYSDAQAFYDFARQHYPPEQIILYGRSLGSTFATRVAARNPVPQLILETPFASMRSLFYTYYPFLPHLFFFKYSFPTHRYLREVTCPVVIFQGDNDYVVPYSCAARLKASLKPTDTFYTIPEGSHNNLLYFDVYNRKMQEVLGGVSSEQ